MLTAETTITKKCRLRQLHQ